MGFKWGFLKGHREKQSFDQCHSSHESDAVTGSLQSLTSESDAVTGSHSLTGCVVQAGPMEVVILPPWAGTGLEEDPHALDVPDLTR